MSRWVSSSLDTFVYLSGFLFWAAKEDGFFAAMRAFWCRVVPTRGCELWVYVYIGSLGYTGEGWLFCKGSLDFAMLVLVFVVEWDFLLSFFMIVI